MTIPQQSPRNVSTAAPGATVFPYDFKILADTDMQVQVNGVTKTLGVHYAVSGVGNEGGGQVVFTAAMAGGETVMRRRLMPFARSNDFQYLGDLRSFTLNNDQDAPIMMLQQIADDVDRSLKLPPSATGNGNIGELIPLAPLVVTSDGQSIESGSTQLTGDMLLRPNLAQDAPGKGADLVAYRDGLSAAYLQVTSAMAQGAPVSVLRGIDPTKHAAILDGSTTVDHAPAIQALLSEMGSKGRGHLMHDHGTLTIGTQLNIPGDVTFSGGGIKSILKPVATVNAMVRTNGSNAQVRSLQFLNSGGLATAGLTLGADFCRTYDCYFANLKRGIQIDGAQALRIVHPVIIGSDFGIFNINDGRNSVIDQAHIQGGTCIWIDKVSIQNEGLRIVNSFLAPSITSDPNSGHGIVITGGLEIEIAQCIIDNVDRYGIYLPNVYTVEAIKLVNSWIGCDAGVTGSCGVVTRGPVKQIQLIANTITGAQGYGLDIDNSAGPPNAFDVSHNRFYSNQAGDYRIRGLIESDIAFNQFNSTTGSAEMDNTSAVRFVGNTYTMAPLLKSTASKYTQNKGVAGVDTDHGTWVPSYINVANATSITNSFACFEQVGKTVYASGNFGASATAANTLTQVRVSPPPGLAITGGNKAAGTAAAYTGSNFIAGICNEHSSGDILVSYQPTGTGGIGVDWSAMWRVP